MNSEKKTNVWCLVGFIASFFLASAGLACSIVGLVQSKKTGEDGKGFAIAGIIIGALKLVLSVLFIIFFGWLFKATIDEINPEEFIDRIDRDTVRDVERRGRDAIDKYSDYFNLPKDEEDNDNQEDSNDLA